MTVRKKTSVVIFTGTSSLNCLLMITSPRGLKMKSCEIMMIPN